MKKIFLTIIMTFIFVMPTASASSSYDEIYDFHGNAYYYKTAESFASGSGTEDDPYIITSWEEFNLMRERGCGDDGTGLYFKLVTNLGRNDGSVSWSPNHVTWQDVFNYSVGTSDNPFQGTFDGGNHELLSTNMYLFDVIGENGTVRNARKGFGIAKVNNGLIENCRTSTTGTTFGSSNIGSIAGENTGTIRRCVVKGTTSSPGFYNIKASGSGIGGICGFNNGGTIEECYSSMEIRSDNAHVRAIGGIAGDNTGGIIRNCCSFCSILNNGTETGGIVGKLNYGTVENCLSCTGRNGSYELSGAIAGSAYGDSKIINCRFDGLMVGNSKIEDAQYGWEREDLKDLSIYGGYDFENVWVANEGSEPILRCFYTYSDCVSHWARDVIEKLAEKNKISGYEDGAFRPDDTITKAEFITMLGYTCNRDEVDIPYTDIPVWALPYVKYAVYTNLLDEHLTISDTLLGADNPITRLEAGVIIGRMQRYWRKELTFSDTNKIPDWAVEPMEYAVYTKCITGYEDGTFRPYNTLTRAEAASIISKMN